MRGFVYLDLLLIILLIFSNWNKLINAQYPNGITFGPVQQPTSAPSTSRPVISGCGCYAVSSCTALSGGSGVLDPRIVTPNCPTGQIYCCPNGATPPPAPAPTTTTTTTTAAPTTTTAAPTTTTAAPARCGVRQNIQSNLPQGSGQARYGSYPWDAAILQTNDNYIGGGVLVNNRYVLTAAHKVVNYTSNLAGLKVRLGEWNAIRAVEPIPVQEYGIERITIHPNFNNGNLFNDIAVVRLNRNVPLGTAASINTACLPPAQNSRYVGQNCWVSGWGKDAFTDGSYQSILKEAQVPILDNGACQNQLRNTRLGQYFVLDSSFLCAGGMTNLDACTGDGGSPLVCQGSNGQWTVVGLVAWGIGCGQQNVPGVYVNIAQLLPWINSQIN